MISPHPDDETIGCGGTIARLAEEGVNVFIQAISVGNAARLGGESVVDVRQVEFSAACEALGASGSDILWTDESRHMRLNIHPTDDLVKALESEARYSLRTVQPDLVLMPAAGSYNQDHAAVHRAAYIAVRPHDPKVKPVPRIVLGYRTPEEQGWANSTERATTIVDTSGSWRRKEKALRCYSSQIWEGQHPRSYGHIEDLDRAAGGTLGLQFAERFVCYRFLSGRESSSRG